MPRLRAETVGVFVQPEFRLRGPINCSVITSEGDSRTCQYWHYGQKEFLSRYRPWNSNNNNKANKFCARTVKVLSKLFNGTSCLEPILLLRLPLKHRCSHQPADQCLFISRRAQRSPRCGRAAAAQRPQLLPPARERLPGQGEQGACPHRCSLQSLSRAARRPEPAPLSCCVFPALAVTDHVQPRAGHKPVVFSKHLASVSVLWRCQCLVSGCLLHKEHIFL